jgi:hypothetical protein
VKLLSHIETLKIISNLLDRMVEDCSKEVKKLLSNFKQKGIEFGKPIKLLSFKSGGLTEEQIEEELFNFDFLKLSYKQNRNDEARYILYFVFTKNLGERLL